MSELGRGGGRNCGGSFSSPSDSGKGERRGGGCEIRWLLQRRRRPRRLRGSPAAAVVVVSARVGVRGLVCAVSEEDFGGGFWCAGGGVDGLFVELWRACAGPLVTVPAVGERVFYLPQGHIEQVRRRRRRCSAERENLPLLLSPTRAGWGRAACVAVFFLCGFGVL